MPKTEVLYYCDEKGCPVLKWLKGLPKKIRARGYQRIERLAELGHELRRPEVDYIRDEIYELRWRFQSVNYRILFFFHGQGLVILAHSLTKEDRIPQSDIEIAIKRKKAFETDPEAHILGEGP